MSATLRKAWHRIFREPPAPKIRQLQLDDAERQRLYAAANREYYAAMEAMLEERIARLRAEQGSTIDTRLLAPGLAVLADSEAHRVA